LSVDTYKHISWWASTSSKFLMRYTSDCLFETRTKGLRQISVSVLCQAQQVLSWNEDETDAKQEPKHQTHDTKE